MEGERGREVGREGKREVGREGGRDRERASSSPFLKFKQIKDVENNVVKYVSEGNTYWNTYYNPRKLTYYKYCVLCTRKSPAFTWSRITQNSAVHCQST